MKWFLEEPLQSIYIYAEPDGVYIRSEKYDLSTNIRFYSEALTLLGQSLPTLIPQILEQGYAETVGQSIRIPYDRYVSLEDVDIHAFEELTPWAPFFIELSSGGTLGLADFKYQVRFFYGNNKVSLERQGCFVKYYNSFYRLDRQAYALITEVDRFRNLSSEEKSSTESLISFAAIRGLAEGVGAQIDQFIENNKVLIPPRIGIDLVEEANDKISFVPYIEGVSRDELRKVFLRSEDVSNLYLDDGKGGRVRLIFNADQEEVLKRMTKVRHLSGHEKTKVLRDPQGIFDGVAGSVDLDLGDFGPRVKGIGDFPFIAQPVIQRSNTGIFEPHDDGLTPGKSRLDAGIKCRYADGTEETVLFKSADELISFNHQVQKAYKEGSGNVNLDGKLLIVDHDFACGVSELANRIIHKSPPKNLKIQEERKYLLIYENDEALEYKETYVLDKFESSEYLHPTALKKDIPLKAHQRKGIKWLQNNYLSKRHGCLLADDMGLGKTLQILIFIAWLIEKNKLSPDDSVNPEAAPWNPVLIITPVMLLENETWIQDIKKFFKNDGAIFRPWYVLHKQALKEMRIDGISGQETKIQRAILDLEKLRQYRVIFTNYETIVNYQFSFACMKSAWTVVVSDEAQAHKTPKTKISHALKSMAPCFRIACTGTPVETRLLDIWNIMDYLQPGELLGSANAFSKAFEQPLNDEPEKMKEILDSLRSKLHLGKPTAFVLRREKSIELEGLPKKYEHKIECLLSDEQRDRHIEYINRAHEGGEGNHPFALIQGLMNLYQHPALIPRYAPFDSGDLNGMLVRCPKLSTFLEILRKVKRSREKALVFTRSLDMQQLLAASIFETFGQSVDIINGATARNETLTSANTRKAMLNRFRENTDINFIILSPDVAGIGLNLVEANHVIHYGRWWNPAKESQATDRTYRIGQERDVHVYYLIAKDPQGKFKSFDEKLDTLVERRRQMASDFLAPMPGEQDLQNELYKDIFSEAVPHHGGEVKSLTLDEVRALPWDRFEALVALIENKKGRNVILTPRTGDMGIDVVSIEGNIVRLIQCKHRRHSGETEMDLIAETINAFDNYRMRYFSGKNCQLRPVLATNGQIAGAVLEQCKYRDIEPIASQELQESLKSYTCTIPDIEFMEASRLESMVQFSHTINEYSALHFTYPQKGE